MSHQISCLAAADEDGEVLSVSYAETSLDFSCPAADASPKSTSLCSSEQLTLPGVREEPASPYAMMYDFTDCIFLVVGRLLLQTTQAAASHAQVYTLASLCCKISLEERDVDVFIAYLRY